MVAPATYIEYPKPEFELADVFRLFGQDYRCNHNLPLHHLKLMRDIENCRTSALGGHIDECDNCGAISISYNSCRNRHCPKCQRSNRDRWIEARASELLPIPYFHVVFTLPDKINSLAQFNQSLIYNLLFKAASETLLEFGQRHLGGELGITAVLHSWGQTLAQHIHLHCIVTGGALAGDGSKFNICKNGFLFRTRAMAVVFRAKFLDRLRKAYGSNQVLMPETVSEFSPDQEFSRLHRSLMEKKWVVYAKMPFAGPERVIKYIGRYTHKIAISNRRIVSIKEGRESFSYKDYRDGGREKVMRVSGEEFIRRYLLHVMPEGFVRMRHFGILASSNKEGKPGRCRQLLAGEKPKEETSQQEEEEREKDKEQEKGLCPSCGVGRLNRKKEIERSKSPAEINRLGAVA